MYVSKYYKNITKVIYSLSEYVLGAKAEFTVQFSEA